MQVKKVGFDEWFQTFEVIQESLSFFNEEVQYKIKTDLVKADFCNMNILNRRVSLVHKQKKGLCERVKFKFLTLTMINSLCSNFVVIIEV